MNAFSSAMDELKSSGKADITSEEEEIIRAAMLQEIPDLTDSLNENIAKLSDYQYEYGAGRSSGTIYADGNKAADDSCKRYFVPAAHSTVLEEQAGFIWCAVVFGIMALIYMCLE